MVRRGWLAGPARRKAIDKGLRRARAIQVPVQERVETALEVAEAPLADTGRYDRLRLEANHA